MLNKILAEELRSVETLPSYLAIDRDSSRLTILRYWATLNPLVNGAIKGQVDIKKRLDVIFDEVGLMLKPNYLSEEQIKEIERMQEIVGPIRYPEGKISGTLINPVASPLVTGALFTGIGRVGEMHDTQRGISRRKSLKYILGGVVGTMFGLVGISNSAGALIDRDIAYDNAKYVQDKIADYKARLLQTQ